jgi:NAD(P)H-nitrite reductase large subunit
MLFRPQTGLEAITTADTLICRCEEVPAGEIRTAVEKGAQELDTLKIWTRVGQGPCQGRICGPLLARLLARQSGRTEEATGFFNVRPPLKPVLLGDLARGENE